MTDSQGNQFIQISENMRLVISRWKLDDGTEAIGIKRWDYFRGKDAYYPTRSNKSSGVWFKADKLKEALEILEKI